jgi:hypothetical protein
MGKDVKLDPATAITWMRGKERWLFEAMEHAGDDEYLFHVSRHDDGKRLWFEVRYETKKVEMGQHLTRDQVLELVRRLTHWLADDSIEPELEAKILERITKENSDG